MSKELDTQLSDFVSLLDNYHTAKFWPLVDAIKREARADAERELKAHQAAFVDSNQKRRELESRLDAVTSQRAAALTLRNAARTESERWRATAHQYADERDQARAQLQELTADYDQISKAMWAAQKMERAVQAQLEDLPRLVEMAIQSGGESAANGDDFSDPATIIAEWQTSLAPATAIEAGDGWVSVEEKLPADRESVIGYIHGSIELCWLHGRDWAKRGGICHPPAYWRSLPAPPQHPTTPAWRLECSNCHTEIDPSTLGGVFTCPACGAENEAWEDEVKS